VGSHGHAGGEPGHPRDRPTQGLATSLVVTAETQPEDLPAWLAARFRPGQVGAQGVKTMTHDPSPPFQVAVGWDGVVATVTVTCEVDTTTAPALASRLLEVAAEHAERLVLDLDGLSSPTWRRRGRSAAPTRPWRNSSQSSCGRPGPQPPAGLRPHRAYPLFGALGSEQAEADGGHDRPGLLPQWCVFLTGSARCAAPARPARTH
jgi:hypothetical protein